MKNLEKKKDEEIQAKKTEINNMAIEKKKLIAEFEETKKVTAGMKGSVRKADIFTFTCPHILVSQDNCPMISQSVVLADA